MSHTCSNQVDLPAYESFEQLDTKLRQALREARRHGGFQIA